MKKFISVIVLFLACSGSAFADKKIEKALERCADTQIAYGNTSEIVKSFYEKNDIYLIMIKEKMRLQKSYDEYGEIYEATYKKYWEDNPRPRMPNRETIRTYSFEDYKKDKAEWDKQEKEFLQPYEDELLKRGELVKKQEQLIKETAQFFISKKLEVLPLKEKTKTIPNYTKKFILCEEAYTKTPKGFMFEWGL